MGVLVYSRSTAVLKAQTSDQIWTFTTQVHARLDEWLDLKHEALRSLSNSRTLASMLEDIALLPTGSSTFRASQNQILEELIASLPNGDSTLFDDYLIITPQGEILVSSNSNWTLEQVSEQTFFIEEVSTSEVSSFIVFSPLPFNQGSDSSIYDVVLISSQPVLTSQGSLIGYVFGLSGQSEHPANLGK